MLQGGIKLAVLRGIVRGHALLRGRHLDPERLARKVLDGQRLVGMQKGETSRDVP